MPDPDPFRNVAMTQPVPEPASAALDRYTVGSRNEIVAFLRQLHEEHCAVTVYFGDVGAFAVTRLLAVKPDFEELVCALPSKPAERDPLLACGTLVFVAFLDQVKLQFAARAAEAMPYEGQPAFRVRLPEQLLRLQRRDFARVRTPLDRPAICLVPWGPDGRQYESVALTDISVGGLAMIAYPERFALPDDGTIANCYLDLPGVGSANVTLRLRHQQGVQDGAAQGCGCEFVDMSPQARVMLQRYINRLDAGQNHRPGTPQLAPALSAAPLA
jgi:c-di-GMP-binding flagellar brake protein YcgR